MATTTIETTLDTIEGRIETLWVVGGNPRTTIRWPNVPFTPPDDAAWIAVDTLWGDGFLETKDGLNVVVGVVNINVFIPTGHGDGDLLLLVDHARDMFNRVGVSGVRFGVPSGPTFAEESKWRQGTVSCAFSVEETIT